MRNRPLLTTVFEKETNPASRRLWHLLLLGDVGSIIWWSEDCIDWKSPELALSAKGKALAPVFKELTSPLARLFLRAERETDPIFIHYSQASVQVNWQLESIPDGSTWIRRFSSYESTHNRGAQVRTAWLKAVQDAGFSPQFLSSAQIEAGALRQLTNAALIFPESFALSDREAAEIRAFLQPTPGRARAAFADGSPGLFDAHGKLRPRGALEDWFAPALSAKTSYARAAGGQTEARPLDIAAYSRQRVAGSAADWPEWIANQLGNLQPPVRVPTELRVFTHRYRLGNARLLAFERNIDYKMSEDLKQAGGNEPLEKPVTVSADLKSPAHVYDLRSGAYLGEVRELRFTLDPWKPSLFALLSEKLAGNDVVAELSARLR
jgi:hypothetical protein